MVLFRKKKESSDTGRTLQLTIIHGNSDTGDQTGKVFNLQTGSNLIGRDPLCEIVFNSGTVSRRHANLKVSYDKKKFTIIDMGSSNGVIVKPSTIIRNDKKTIDSGDEIQIGEIILKLLAADQEDALTTMAVDVKELLKKAEEQKSKSQPGS